MPTIVNRPYLFASLNGATVGPVLSARCSFGFDMRVCEATITLPNSPNSPTLPAIPTGGTYKDTIVLIMGANVATSAVCFTGYLLQYDYSLWPRRLVLVCKGFLYRAAEYENTLPGGTDLTNWAAGPPETRPGQTDQAMVQQVLTTAGVNFSSGNIGGTGKVLGTFAFDISNDADFTGPFTWGGPSRLYGSGVGETALSFIERLDAISEGYRLFETAGGVLYRAQIYGRPRAAFDVPQFTEGVDIFKGSSSRTIIPTRNRALVTGYDSGKTNIPMFLSTQGNNPFQPASEAHTIALSSGMIEKIAETDTGYTGAGPGIGQSCEAVGNYLLAEYNREIVKLTMTTHRDDFIGPGQVHGVLAPHLGITEPLWVQHVDKEISERGVFTQTISYIGGGTPAGSSPPV